MIYRFMKKVSIQNGCWPWLAAKTKDGYGQFNVGGRMQYAHRVSYGMFVGPIGEYHVLHRCDNPSCVRPDHLFLGTHDDNMKDMAAKDRSGRAGGRPKKFLLKEAKEVFSLPPVE